MSDSRMEAKQLLADGWTALREAAQAPLYDEHRDRVEVRQGDLRDLLKERDALERERDEAREALRDMIDLCDHADFRNGNTDQSGMSDEGEYLAGCVIDRCRAALQEPKR